MLFSLTCYIGHSEFLPLLSSRLRDVAFRVDFCSRFVELVLRMGGVAGLCCSRPSPANEPNTNPNAPYIQEWWVTFASRLRKQQLKTFMGASNQNSANEAFLCDLNAELQPIVDNIFHRYDTSSYGVLSQEESARFFDDFVNEERLQVSALCGCFAMFNPP